MAEALQALFNLWWFDASLRQGDAHAGIRAQGLKRSRAFCDIPDTSKSLILRRGPLQPSGVHRAASLPLVRLALNVHGSMRSRKLHVPRMILGQITEIPRIGPEQEAGRGSLVMVGGEPESERRI